MKARRISEDAVAAAEARNADALASGDEIASPLGAALVQGPGKYVAARPVIVRTTDGRWHVADDRIVVAASLADAIVALYPDAEAGASIAYRMPSLSGTPDMLCSACMRALVLRTLGDDMPDVAVGDILLADDDDSTCDACGMYLYRDDYLYDAPGSRDAEYRYYINAIATQWADAETRDLDRRAYDIPDGDAVHYYALRVWDEERGTEVTPRIGMILTSSRIALEQGGDYAWADRSAFADIGDAVNAYLADDPARWDQAN